MKAKYCPSLCGTSWTGFVCWHPLCVGSTICCPLTIACSLLVWIKIVGCLAFVGALQIPQKRSMDLDPCMERIVMCIVMGREYHDTMRGPRWPWWGETKGLHMRRIPWDYDRIPIGRRAL